MQAFAYSVEILKIMTMSDDVEDQDDDDDYNHDHDDDEDEDGDADGVGVVAQEQRCPINPPTSSAFSATLSLRLCSIHPSL